MNLRVDVQITPLSSEKAEQTLLWLKDPDISKNLGLRKLPTLENTIKWIEEAQQNSKTQAFAILDNHRHVGNVVLEDINNFISTARFHIFIGENNLRRSGIGRTATYLICRYAFENLELNKVWLVVHTKNFPAITTYAKLGFRLEGILREEERIDVLYMGLLKTDFKIKQVFFV